MKRVIISSSKGCTTAHRMYSDRAAAWANHDDTQSELVRMLSEEAGRDWENYRPSATMRRIARDKGYKVVRVRAKGAFPYTIEKM